MEYLLLNGFYKYSCPFHRPTEKHDCVKEYVRVVDERSAAVSVEQYDADLIRNLTMLTERPESRLLYSMVRPE